MKDIVWFVFLLIAIISLIGFILRTRTNIKRKKEQEENERILEQKRIENIKLREQEEEKRKKEKYDNDVYDAIKFIKKFVSNANKNAEDFNKSYDTVCENLSKYSSIKYDKTSFNNYKKSLIEYASFDINMTEGKSLVWLLSVKNDMVKTNELFTNEYFSIRNIYNNYLQQESYVINVKSTLKEYYEKAKAELQYTPYKDLMPNEYNMLMSSNSNIWEYYNLAKNLSSNYYKIINYRNEQAVIKAAEERAEQIRKANEKAREYSLRRSSNFGYSSSENYNASITYTPPPITNNYSPSPTPDYDGGSFSGGGSSDNW